MMNGLNILPSYTDYFSLTTASLSLNTASIWIGGMAAAFWAGTVTDMVGRKWAMFIGAAISIVGILLQSAAQNIAMFITGRILIGLASGLSGVGEFYFLWKRCLKEFILMENTSCTNLPG